MSTRSRRNRKRNKKYSNNSSFEESEADQSTILETSNKMINQDSRSPPKLKDDEDVYQMISDLPDTPEGHLAKQIILSMKDILENKLEKFQHSIVSDLTNENKILRKDVIELAEKIDVQKNQIIDLQINQNKMDQYGRRNNLEISGIPDEISHDNLQESVVGILTDIGIKVTSDEIEACQRLPKGKKSKGSKKNYYSFH